MSSTRCGLAMCQVEKRDHGRRWIPGVGFHSWVAPTKKQIEERLRKRYGIS